MSLTDNKIREVQSKRLHLISRNVLFRQEIVHLCKSPALSRLTLKVFQNRIIFTVEIQTGMRPTTVGSVTVNQVRKGQLESNTIWKVTGKIANWQRASKIYEGGGNSAEDKPQENCIRNESYCNGSTNFFEDIEVYVSIQIKINFASDNLFLSIKHHNTGIELFLKPQNLGWNSFDKIIKEACLAWNIAGVGDNMYVTTHALSRTLVKICLKADKRIFQWRSRQVIANHALWRAICSWRKGSN